MPSYKVSKNCRLCLSKNIKIGLKLKKIPIGEKYFLSQKKAKTQKKIPLTISWCPNCKNVQINEVINLKDLWNNYTYLSSQTKAIVDHFNDVAKRILRRFNLNKNDLVFDIGSNDGTFLKCFKKEKLKVLGIDGAKNVAKIANQSGIPTISKFFDFNLSKKIKKKYGKAKIITCFNSFAHTSNLNSIIKGIKNLLHKDGIFVFECQYLIDIYKNKVIGTFFHEHLYHHSLTSLNNLFNSFDLNFFHVEKVNIQKGSIIGYVSIKKLNKSKVFQNLIKNEKTKKYLSLKKLNSLKKYISTQKSKIEQITKNTSSKHMGFYGSARSAPVFIENYGINNKVNYLFDDHELKIGKFSPLINQRVLPTKMIYSTNVKIIIILAYLHSKKIIRKNIKFIKKGGKFIIVYPNVEQVDKLNYKKFL